MHFLIRSYFESMARDYFLEPFRPAVDLQIDYSRELNPQQHAAVTASPGPALVIAGAGSGKTRTLIYRVAYLLEQGVSADRILLLTFTNKAAKEMMRRVTDLLGNDLSSLWGGTFHAVGLRLLRRHAQLVGCSNDFTILDREDAGDLIAACLTDAKIEVTERLFPKPDVLAEIFSLAVNKQEPLPQLIETQFPYFTPLAPEILRVHQAYINRKRRAGIMDFDDLLELWLKLLQEHPDIREVYQRRFQFILVDEYQDTNKLQSNLIDLLAARHKNLMVVGDDAQSIYSWRGAEYKNILEFPDRYPDAQIYKIETNYRSTPEILALANAAIAPNPRQFAKVLVPARKSGPRPGLVVCESADEQARFVSQRVLQLRDEGIPLEEMAVLYRSHFHAMELQLELTRRNIPFSITSGVRFFEQAHIKDVAAYLKLVCNPNDELAFKRIVRLLPGIGGKTADHLWKSFLHQAFPRSEGQGLQAPLAAGLQACNNQAPKKSQVHWAQLTATISQLEIEPIRRQPSAMITLVLEAGYQEYLKKEYPNYRARLEDLVNLAAFARRFESPEDFLAQLALNTLEAERPETPGSQDDECLRLSTIHQAKGLEFSVVFIVMLCEGLFPTARSLETQEDEEEERRLFYVAITRAKDDLYLSYPLQRYSPGRASFLHPSRFVLSLPTDLREEWNLRATPL